MRSHGEEGKGSGDTWCPRIEGETGEASLWHLGVGSGEWGLGWLG